MALSWNEIKDRAIQFSQEWETASREEADAKSFWDDFFHIFGVNRRRVATFEYKVQKGNRNDGYIDLLWKGVLLVEHKSSGKNLDMAHKQAVDYFPGLKDHELPKYICVCNFQEFRLNDLDEGLEHRFGLKDLVNNVQLFGFLAGYQKRTFKDQEPINIEAAYRMGKLHDELKNFGYSGHILEVYLVRILFCLFADDTTIFDKEWFSYYIQNKTKEDGSDLGSQLAYFFQILNTPRVGRPKILDEDLNAFPYVNGKLFEEPLPLATFNSKMRELILHCAGLNWSLISPAIFGSLFQSTMNPEERRNLGAHYTSEKNIMKVIKPLFLDELYEEFNSIKNNKLKLKEFHKKIGNLRLLDPACGCGNFLVISYRELRLLELKILKILQEGEQLAMNIDDLVWISLDQFYGIEIEEWPCRIAEVAMWLIEHQMNMKMSEELGQYYIRLPLQKSARIENANALTMDWQRLLDPINTIDIYAHHTNIFMVSEPIVKYNAVNVQTETYEVIQGKKPEPSQEIKFDFILGNPPFVGARLMNNYQKQDIINVFENSKSIGDLDYVTAWYIKAAKYIQNTKIKVGFVSTNSISQGGQVSILWNILFNYGIKIHFAHRTFRWNNEAKGVAAVHVVIIGFGNFNTEVKKLFDYKEINSEPYEKFVNNINPYLVESNDFTINKNKKRISSIPEMWFGSMPNDDGNFLFDDDEKNKFLKLEPNSEKYFKPFISAYEFLNNQKRWCLWLTEIKPNELKQMPAVMDRIKKVREYRLNSTRLATRKLAEFPSIFGEIRQPKDTYLIIPRVSSENRHYIPIDFFDNHNIVGDTCLSIPNATLYHFGILTSEMHMTWVKYTCGRLKSDYRYSKDIVYNNYPWPLNLTSKNSGKIKVLAQNILDTRKKYPDSSLADLYNPITMPPDLLKAHQSLDKAVDQCYRSQPFTSESERMEFLFELYQQYTQGLFKEEKKKKERRNKEGK